MLNKTAATNVVMHLYKDYVTAPSLSDTLATYSAHEISGYTPVTLTGSSWAITEVSSSAVASYAQQTFAVSDACTIVGYYITDSTDANLLWVEPFETGSWPIPAGGGTVKISPVIKLQ
jgi:hypothetical protein